MSLLDRRIAPSFEETQASLSAMVRGLMVGLSLWWVLSLFLDTRSESRSGEAAEEPTLSTESVANIETFSSPEAIDAFADQATDDLFPQEQKAIDRHFTKSKPRVLDLGCGTGRATRPLSEMGHDIVGVDPSEAMVDEGKATHPEIDFNVGDGTTLHFRDEVFDYVLFSYFGLDYIHPEASRIRALQEIHRVLKPGGKFVFSSHNWWNMPLSVPFEGLDVLKPLFRREDVFDPSERYARVEVAVGQTTVYLSSPAKQRRQLDMNGFELIDVIGKRDTVVRYFEVAPHYVARKADEDS